MIMPILRLAVVMLAACLGLAACGVRGDPEPPPGAEAVAAPAERSAGVEVEAPVAPDSTFAGLDEDGDGDTVRVIGSERRKIYPPMSDSFVLDPLL